MRNLQLAALFSLISLYTFGQDKIYLQNEQKDGKIIEVTEDKVRYKNPLNPGPVYSVSRNKVLFAFSETGNFLVLDKMDPAHPQGGALVNNFLNVPSAGKQDRILTSQKKELVCEITNENDASITVSVNGIDMKLEKSSVAVIVYKDGKHKLLCDPAIAAEVLMEAQTKSLVSLTKPADKPATPAQNVTASANTTVTKTETKNTEGKQSIGLETNSIGSSAPVETLASKSGSSNVVTKEIKPEIKTKEGSKPQQSATTPAMETNTIGLSTPTESKPVKATPTHASVVIKANKLSSISYKINDTLTGDIKPAMVKKLLLKPGQYNYSLDDKQGHVTESSLILSEENLGKEIEINFPEINYAAIKAEEARRKKTSADSLAAIKTALAEATKAEHEKMLKTYSESVMAIADEILAAQNELEKTAAQIKNGSREFDDAFLAKGKELAAARIRFADEKKIFLDSAIAPADKEKRLFIVQQLKTKEDKFSTKSDAFIQNVQAKKEPMSQDIITALKNARAVDLGFFVSADSINEMKLEGDYLIVYAVKKKLHHSVIKEMINKGAEVNFYGKRFADNPEIYQTPLAIAAINGDENTVKVLAEAKASFLPPLASAKEKRHNLKYILSKVTNPNVITVLKAANYNLNDGTEDLMAALKSFEANMVRVEGGSFTMGCTEDQKNDCVGAEMPAIQVSVKSFSLNKFEVTRRQWMAIMDGDNLGEFQDCLDCPIESITYDTAMAFLKNLNVVSEKKYRLPTEAEWEYAARGGKAPAQVFKFAGSNDFNEVSLSKDNTTGKPKPVGQKKPNDLGLFDMSGNVAEWCSDWYMEKYYLNSTKNNPTGPEEGFQKVIRGGAWNLTSWSARVSRRVGVEKNIINSGIGFRLASE